MQWNLLFSGITALCALVGSGALILAVRQFKFSTWLKAQEIFVESDFRKARGVVLPHYWQKDKEWTDDDRKEGELVCARMDELARLVPYIREKTVLETWDDPMGKCWDVLQDFVRQERSKSKWDVKWKAFEDLGKKALARVKERERRHEAAQKT
jgi:hypothetical protein